MSEDRMVPMGNCSTCHKPWFMTQGERGFYEKIIQERHAAGEEFSLPKNCFECRQEKKKNNKTSPRAIIIKLDWIVKQAQRGMYTMEDDKLISDLNFLSNMIHGFFGKKGTNDQTEKSVGQSTESSTIQA